MEDAPQMSLWAEEEKTKELSSPLRDFRPLFSFNGQ